MFWQGGGRKRLKNLIEQKMEVAPSPFEPGKIGRTDDDLIHIYYHRDMLPAQPHSSQMPNNDINSSSKESPFVSKSQSVPPSPFSFQQTWLIRCYSIFSWKGC